MGRIKTKAIKRLTHQLMELHKGEFTDDYAKNKEIVMNFANIHSGKLKNIISGYITKLVKMEKRNN